MFHAIPVGMAIAHGAALRLSSDMPSAVAGAPGDLDEVFESCSGVADYQTIQTNALFIPTFFGQNPDGSIFAARRY